MRDYCEEAVRFGNQYLPPDQKCRHITVLLNPVANGRKSKANYEKYCAPLLHLAGIRVSLVITEAEGQAGELMEIMDNTDAVLIAGGNGTVHEAVTGLLRRPDSWYASHRFPIGIIPVGKRNTIAYDLNKIREKNLKHYEVLAESTMSVVRELLKPVDVMKVEGRKGRPVFALEELSFGKMRDTFANVDKYWYFGSKVKPYLALIFNSFKRLSSVENIDISFSPPCTGCSKCYKRFETHADGSVRGGGSSRDTSTRWWHIFVSRKTTNSNINTNDDQSKATDFSSITNENCSQWSTLRDLRAANVLIRNSNQCKLSMIIHWEPLARTQFVADGVRLYNSEPLPETTTDSNVQMIDAMDINIDLKEDNNSSSDAETTDGTDDKIPSEDNLPNDQWFSIDTESYERQSVRITLLPKAVNVYAVD